MGRAVLVTLTAIGIALVALSPAAVATSHITVLVNGSPVAFDVPPVVEGGRTLVPVRGIFEALNAEVIWEGTTRTITARSSGITIGLRVDARSAQVNGLTVPLDVPAKIMTGRKIGRAHV